MSRTTVTMTRPRTHAPTTRHRTMESFRRHFKTAKRAVGHGHTTSNLELEDALKKLRLLPMKVTTMCDVARMKRDGVLPKYVIANVSCEPPGQHWVAYYRGIKYDPLGKDRSGTAEQNDVETNCGQRCIGYLLMCQKANKAIFF